jgi:hypothetical protein
MQPPSNPSTVMPEQLAPQPPQSPAKWSWWVGILTGLAVADVGFVFASMAYLVSLAKSGVSGTEFMAILLIPFILASFPLSLSAFILAGLHLKRHSLVGRIKAFIITCLVLSGLILAFGVYVIISNLVSLSKFSEAQQQSDQHAREMAAAYAPKEVTEADALNLLTTCQIHQFYYGPQKDVQDEIDAAGRTNSGLVLIRLDDKPWRLTATDQMGAKLLPSVEASKQKCGDLFINSSH